MRAISKQDINKIQKAKIGSTGRFLTLRTPLVGILIHPWDIKDEGVRTVGETLAGFHINAVFIAVNAPSEPHPPQPVDARLTHNPKRKRYVSEEGRFYYEVDQSNYVNSIILPHRSSDGDLAGYDVFEESRHIEESGLKRYAWLTTLHNGDFIDGAHELAVVDLISQSDENWMCPHNANVVIQTLEVVNEIQGISDLEGILLDNFWWKYPHTLMASLESGIVCFCEHCEQKMADLGIDTRKLRRALSQIPRAVRALKRADILRIGEVDADPLLEIAGLPHSEGSGYADIMNVLFEDTSMRKRLPELAEADSLGIFGWLERNPILFDWMDFKADGLVNMLATLRELIKSNDPDFEIGLGIWSPRSSWTVCQSYTKLRQHCDWMMPMVYHRIWGWYSACASEELFEIVHPRTPHLFASYKEILRAWFRLAGYSARPLHSQIYNGLPPSLIKKELARARSLVGSDFPLHAGLQLWEPGSRIPHPKESAQATDIAMNSQVQGLIIQAYGWAPMPNLIAAGRTIQRLSSDRTPPSPDS